MTTVRSIATSALGELMLFDEGHTPSAGAMRDTIAALNALVSSWRTEGMLIFFPSGTTWRGDWAERTVYAVNESVNRSGSIYTCSAAHTSSLSDKPGVSQNGATYWTQYEAATLAIDDTFPLGREFERGVISMLAVEIGPMFSIEPSAFTLRKASEGKTALLAAFMPINPVRVDNGLIRMPSQIWPYNIDQIT